MMSYDFRYGIPPQGLLAASGVLGHSGMATARSKAKLCHMELNYLLAKVY